MGLFELAWRSSTRKDLRRLPPLEVARILAEVEALPSNPFPRGCEKLAGSDHTWRIRIGDYRVVYEVLSDAKLIVIQRVRHRKDVYRH